VGINFEEGRDLNRFEHEEWGLSGESLAQAHEDLRERLRLLCAGLEVAKQAFGDQFNRHSDIGWAMASFIGSTNVRPGSRIASVGFVGHLKSPAVTRGFLRAEDDSGGYTFLDRLNEYYLPFAIGVAFDRDELAQNPQVVFAKAVKEYEPGKKNRFDEIVEIEELPSGMCIVWGRGGKVGKKERILMTLPKEAVVGV
jgi:hypothetical protein